jgi:hydroxymethylglutaryl-CoA lyase
MGNLVRIYEVGPRDGLQNEKTIVSPADKIQFIKLLMNAGLTHLEVTSFVRAESIPQMADAEEVYQATRANLGSRKIQLSCLVPNLKGYEKARQHGVEEIALFSATSNTFNQKNINTDVAGSFERLKDVVAAAQADKKKIRAYISTAFGCPYEGKMPVAKLMDVIERFQKFNVDEISIGDTIGVATPNQVKSYLKEIATILPLNNTALHFHDTRGMAVTNVLVSLEHGIRTFDSSAAGLGGCPYAKGATGNVATEDLLYLLEDQGMSTGIDMDKIIEASLFMLKVLGKKTTSKFLTARLAQMDQK